MELRIKQPKLSETHKVKIDIRDFYSLRARYETEYYILSLIFAIYLHKKNRTKEVIIPPKGRLSISPAPCALTPYSKQTIAIQEQLDGKTADWIEKVSDEEYQVRREARMFLWTYT